MATVWDFEEAVWKLEGVRIVIRAPWDDEVEEYSPGERAWDEQTVAKFLDANIRYYIGDREVVIVDGSGKRWTGTRKQLGNVRRSYNE